MYSEKIATIIVTAKGGEEIECENQGDPEKLHDAMLANIKRIKDDMARFTEDAEEKEE